MLVQGLAQAKGINFTGVKKYVEWNYGEEMWKQMLESLSPEARPAWDRHHDADAGYPFAAFKEMMSVMTSTLRTTKESDVAAIYEFIADQGLSGMNKIFFRITQPSYVIRNYPALWSRFFNAGTVEVPSAGRGRGSVRFLLPEIFDDWLTPACLGYSKKAIEMGGGKELTLSRTSYQKKPNNQFESVYELRWTE